MTIGGMKQSGIENVLAGLGREDGSAPGLLRLSGCSHSLVWTSRSRLDKVLHSFNSNCWDDVRDFWINGMAFLGILDSHS